MEQQIQESHITDSNHNPAGGKSSATGFVINWQNGPLGRGDDRKPPNGAFVESIIQAAIGRMSFYQRSKFRCLENAEVIHLLKKSISILNGRTKARDQRGVEGTHQI